MDERNDSDQMKTSAKNWIRKLLCKIPKKEIILHQPNLYKSLYH